MAKVHFEIEKVFLIVALICTALLIGIKIGISQPGAVQSHLGSEITGPVAQANTIRDSTTGTYVDARSIISASTFTLRHYFITSTTYNGNLGGQSGADAKCNADSGKINGKTYKAVLDNSVWHPAAASSTSPWVYWSAKPGGLESFSIKPDVWMAASGSKLTCSSWTSGVSSRCGYPLHPGYDACSSSGSCSLMGSGCSGGTATSACTDNDGIDPGNYWVIPGNCARIYCDSLHSIFCVEV